MIAFSEDRFPADRFLTSRTIMNFIFQTGDEEWNETATENATEINRMKLFSSPSATTIYPKSIIRMHRRKMKAPFSSSTVVMISEWLQKI